MNAPALPFVLPAQPLLATDLAAFVLVVLAGLYAALWRRDREPGMVWLSLAFATLGLYWATTRWGQPSGPYIDKQFFNMLPILGVAALSAGLIQYLHVTGRARRLAWLALAPFPILGLAVVAASFFVAITRTLATFSITGGLIACAVLALWSVRREPGAGHGLVGAALLSVPLANIALLLAGVDVVYLRFVGPLPVIFFGLTLLTVSLLRRRRALEAEIARRAAAEAALAALNASLERQVAQRTADLQEMVAALESFNRSVSHDLRGPLGGIAGLARLAEEGLARGDPAPALRMLPLIRRQSESSVQLVGALLELARVGDAPMNRQAVDLAELARETVQALRTAGGSETLTQIDIGALPTVDADPALLRAVFTNLIGNGLKFCAGRAEGRIDLRSRDEADAVVIEVADNGPGFDEAAASTLFKPFQRLHGARYEGHGVGLSIVRRAVERHGGRVWARGRPGAGATFSFSLPRASA